MAAGLLWFGVGVRIILGVIVASCATPEAGIPARQSTSCGITMDARGIFYPPGRKDECERVLKGLADLRRQHKEQGQLSEVEYLRKIIELLDGPDARAVLAASTRQGFLEALREQVEQRLRELLRE